MVTKACVSAEVISCVEGWGISPSICRRIARSRRTGTDASPEPWRSFPRQAFGVRSL